MIFARITGLLLLTLLLGCQEDPQKLLQKAETLRKEGNYPEARKVLDQVLELEKSHVAYKEYGNYYFHYEHDYDMALSYFRKSLEVKPDYINSIHNMGAAYIKKYEVLREAKNENTEYLEEAKKWLAKALAQDPNFYLSYQEYAKYFFYKEDYKTALEYCNLALRHGADDASIKMLIGQIYLVGFKDYETALTNFQTAYSKFSRHAPLLYLLAKTHKELNHKPEMEAYYYKYLEALREMNASAEILEKAEKEKSEFQSNS